MRTLLICTALVACAACNKANTPAAASDTDTAASTQAIDKLESDQIAAMGQKYLGGATDLYADDAVFIDENGSVVTGKEAIKTGFKQLIEDPALKIDYKTGPKTFSSSGDMAYSTASFTETYSDSKTGKPVTIKGTNLSVWKKQADGSWQLVADSNPGAPAPAEKK